MSTQDSLAHFFRSRLFFGIIIGVGVILVLVIVFESGVALGYHEATFSSHWGANYERNFGGTGMQSSMGLPDGHEPQPHGASGEIISVSGSTLVIQDTNRQEQKIDLDSTTVIRNAENTVDVSSLTTGTYVVVVGDPNDTDGDIDAKLIRILPAPPTSATTTP